MKPNNLGRNLRRLDCESGQTTAWTVAILVLLFAIMAFAVDLGFMFHARRVMQNAADPAALAGAAALSNCALSQDPRGPEGLAEHYAERNSAAKIFTVSDDAPVTTVRPNGFSFTDENGTTNFDTVYAKVRRTESFVFGRFLGLLTSGIPAEAEAACVYGNELDGICPFFIVAPDPSQQPVFGQDPDGDGPRTPPLISGFGIDINRVYRFDFSSSSPYGQGERGFLEIFQAGNIRDIVSNGCVGDLQNNGPCDLNEETITEEILACTKTGNTDAVTKGSNDYYDYEGSAGYPSHSDCNIMFDEALLPGNDPSENSPPLDPSDTVAPYTEYSDEDIEELIDLCDDDPNPNDMISGRLWPIGILMETPDNGGNKKYSIKYIALMYQVCVAYDDKSKNDCGSDPNTYNNQSMYGMFVNARQVNFKVQGVGSGPFGPMHVVLVR